LEDEDIESKTENEDSESENEVVKAKQDAAAEVEQDAPESVAAEEKQSTLTTPWPDQPKMSESELSNMLYVVQTQIKDLSMRQQKLFTQLDDDDVFYLFLQKQNMLRTVCKSKQIQKPDQNLKRKKL
jgi:hypothetical protein